MTRDQYASDPFRAAYFWEAHVVAGLIVAAEFLPSGERSGASLAQIPKPFDLFAKPYRSTLPALHIAVPPGFEPIWEHFVATRLGIGGGERRREREALLFGRRGPDGHEEVLVVLPSGEAIRAPSVAVAKATILEGAALFG